VKPHLWVHDRAMSTATNPRIALELVAGGDPIQGSIEHADGSRQTFWGWLELIETLQRLANTKPGPDVRARRGQPPRTEEEP
jgi:hypothetical protein